MATKYSHVLIVDDDPIVHQVLEAFFVGHGIDVSSAMNGGKAAAMLDAHNDVDLIITDIHMPDADGIELIQRLHADGRQAPIVVISSASSTIMKGVKLLASVHKLKLIGTLGKPIAFDALTEMLGLADAAAPAS